MYTAIIACFACFHLQNLAFLALFGRKICSLQKSGWQPNRPTSLHTDMGQENRKWLGTVYISSLNLVTFEVKISP